MAARRTLEDLLRRDAFARLCWLSARRELEDTPAKREQMQRIRKNAAEWGGVFLELLLRSGLSAESAAELKRELTGLRIELPRRGASSELMEFYKALEVVEDVAGKAILLAFPEKAIQPLSLYAYPPLQVGPAAPPVYSELVTKLREARQGAGVDDAVISTTVLTECRRLLHSLRVPAVATGAVDVYLGGPYHYALAGDSFTLTFATGSGLPNPLEWHGSLPFSATYGVPMKRLAEKKLDQKHPLRAGNFTFGICYPVWAARRIYVWQRSKTAADLQTALALAEEAGTDGLFLSDAVQQLTLAFATPNLMILQLQTFPEELELWTRVSKSESMISCRHGTPQNQIGHAIWLRPGIHIPETAIKVAKGLVLTTSGALLSYGLKEQTLVPFLQAAACWLALSALFAPDSTAVRERTFSTGLLEVERVLNDTIWRQTDLPGLVKRAEGYGAESRRFAISTLASLLSIDETMLEDRIRTAHSSH